MLVSPFGVAIAGEPQLYQIPPSEVVRITDSSTAWKYELYVRLPEDYAETAETRDL